MELTLSVRATPFILLLVITSGTADSNDLQNKLQETKTHDCPVPFGFPPWIKLRQERFINYAKTIYSRRIWVATPKNTADVISIVNWAGLKKYQLRAFGFGHAWSPLVIQNGTSCLTDRIVLLKMRKHLNSMEISKSDKGPATVTVQAGADMLALLSYLEVHGFGLHSFPQPGDISVGGALAISAHGMGLNTDVSGKNNGEHIYFGALSNTVVSFKAVVWKAKKQAFVLKTFTRASKEVKALLTCLGRLIITEATIQVIKNYNLRGLNVFNIPPSELLASGGGGTFSSYIEATDGRVDITWFPHADKAWLRLFTVSPTKPESSRKVSAHIDYNFVPSKRTAELKLKLDHGNYKIKSIYQAANFKEMVQSVNASGNMDIWGTSRNLLLVIPGPVYIDFAYTITTSRSNIQPIIRKATQYFQSLLQTPEFQTVYLDSIFIQLMSPDSPDILGAETPTFSSSHPIQELDVVIIMELLPHYTDRTTYRYMSVVEEYLNSEIHDGRSAFVRPFWAKNYAYTAEGPFTDQKYLRTVLPTKFPGNTDVSEGWNWVISTLNKFDPNHVFSNEYLDKILVEI